MILMFSFILFYFLMLDDCVTYQANRYQLDRTRETLSIQRVSFCFAIGFELVYELCHYLFPNEPLIFALVLVVAINECFRWRKSLLQQLHYTKRMVRFIGVSIFVFSGIFFLVHFIKQDFQMIIIALFFTFHSFLFYSIVLLVHPMEEKIRQKYVHRAKEKLKDYHGTIIGITGSYGKTSIKNILTQVLSCMYSTIQTPYSYNNQMGISKTILEELSINHEIFVCEMGADHLHEIEDLANFVHPTIGIVSAIGPQHLSTFKSIENILHEKLQLLESLPENGIGFINQDNQYLRDYPYQMKCRIKTIGIEHLSDIQANHVEWNNKGSEFDVVIDQQEYHFRIQLLGVHNIMNCLFAIGVAHELHVPMSFVQVMLQQIQPPPHRLELKRWGKGMCIDNAYNSNPDSAKLSLQVLKQMPHDRYCITPGFIDLGSDHDFYSFEFGKQLADACDWVILVGNCPKIMEGLVFKAFNESHILQYSTMNTAIQSVSLRLKENDTCLIENDIPKIFTQ